jgi:hypothetical protein
MRHSNLAAALLLGVGMFTAHTSAQQIQPPADTTAVTALQETLSRRARAALEAALAARAAEAGSPLKGGDRRFQFNGDVDHLRPSTDCGMPVIKGDPAIDPQFSKQPPSPPGSPVRHTMKVIPLQPCLR